MDTLAFGYILPTAGRIRDFHPLERAPAGRTIKTNACPKTGHAFLTFDHLQRFAEFFVAGCKICYSSFDAIGDLTAAFMTKGVGDFF